MTTYRMIADVKEDRRVVLTLPTEVPTGRTELVITIASPEGGAKPPRGVPASTIRGIAAGDGPVPDDDTIARWVEERRTEKHG
jgi:hypothetical protein